MFGLEKEQIIDFCLRSELPGTKTDKWPGNHPIWDSFLPGYPSPRDAWKDETYVTKAVDNLFWILDKSIRENKYEDFVEKHRKAFEDCVVEDGKIISGRDLLCAVLARFTIAKIAPKVTALKGFDMVKIIEASGVDISNGVYMPMAGFGGIKDAAERWFKTHSVPKVNGSWNHLVEAYDINPKFCEWYGWGQRDMLAQVVETDKACLVCPPFGKEYEHWKGTPDKLSDITFIEWYDLIKQYVKAPSYIIIGPEVDYTGTGSNKGLDSEGNKRNGLFTKTIGIMQWTDEIHEHFKNDAVARKKAGIKE